jgi:hypothetical protein
MRLNVADGTSQYVCHQVGAGTCRSALGNTSRLSDAQAVSGRWRGCRCYFCATAWKKDGIFIHSGLPCDFPLYAGNALACVTEAFTSL